MYQGTLEKSYVVGDIITAILQMRKPRQETEIENIKHFIVNTL